MILIHNSPYRVKHRTPAEQIKVADRVIRRNRLPAKKESKISAKEAERMPAAEIGVVLRI
jgi:hypothetical protein